MSQTSLATHQGLPLSADSGGHAETEIQLIAEAELEKSGPIALLQQVDPNSQGVTHDTAFKRKLTACMSADVVGYSRLMGLDEAQKKREYKSKRIKIETRLRDVL